MNTTKKKQTHRYREQSSGYQWGEVGRGNIGVEVWEIQSTGCKLGSRMYFTTWGTLPIFYYNCKWKVTFKYCINIKKNFFKARDKERKIKRILFMAPSC